ncbi:MAG TPA: hypothetical protein VIL42_09310 [Sphingomicrobium sp.]|jgi:uncharacterized protein (DUF2345 family)
MTNLPLNAAAFPDIVAEWAREEAGHTRTAATTANDNQGLVDEINDPLLALVARAEIAATRLW